MNGITNKTWTYKDTLNDSIAVARMLQGVGVKQNDVVSIVCENRYEFPTITFGTLFLNAILGPVNVTYTGRKFI